MCSLSVMLQGVILSLPLAPHSLLSLSATLAAH